jgi:3',5'-cyclic AMP phosphodiesterase CpdA
MRLVVVSDSHLSPLSPAADGNWAAVVDHVAADRPDLVVHCGDLTASAGGDPTTLDHARRRLDELAVPWRVVPGNHDVGNPWNDRARLASARSAYEATVGERFWWCDHDAGPAAWRLVGVDSQALVTGHPDDEDGWSRLALALDTDRPVALFQHRPVAPSSSTERDTDRRYLPEPHRARFRDLLAHSSVRLVVSGHVHQWRDECLDGIRYVWAPSTWATMTDSFQPVIGDKVVGLAEIDLGVEVDARLVVPDGLTQLVHDPDAVPAH